MSKKSDISDIIEHITTIKDWRMRSPLSYLFALLLDESVLINTEAIELNSILRSAPEISKLHAERIKKYKRSLRKRAAKKESSDQSKLQTTQLDLVLDVLNFEKQSLLREKRGLEREIHMYSLFMMKFLQ